MHRAVRDKPSDNAILRNASVAFVFVLTLVAAAAGFVESRQSMADYRAAPALFDGR